MAAVAEKELKDEKIKTAPNGEEGKSDDQMSEEEVKAALEKMTGAQKAAVFLIAIGSQPASAILRCLDDAEVETISVEIASMRNMRSEIVEAVILEFRDLGWAQSFMAQGGVAYARTALAEALGPRRAEEIMMRVEAAMEVSAFHLLQTVETSQLINFLNNEHPQTAALILAHLNPRKSAEVISSLEQDLQNEIIYRLCTMGKTSPALLNDIEEVIRQQVGTLFGGELSAAGGIESVAMILNLTPKSSEKHILEALAKRDQDIAIAVKNLMFVFDDLVGVSDRDLQRILVEVEQRDLALGLKGASEELKAKLLGNISQRASEAIVEEIELMGPVRVSDVEEAQRRILEIAQTLEEQEEITLARGGEDSMMI